MSLHTDKSTSPSANGDRNDPLVLLEMKEIKAAIEIEKLTATASWMTFFSTPGMRIRFYVILLVGTATQYASNLSISLC